MLEKLTYPEISYFIHHKFQALAHFGELERREPRYARDLLEEIVRKAAGVFPWVHLVVQSLLAGLVNGDRVSDLQRRLDAMPPDLEKFFEKMLKVLEPYYFEHAAEYFQIIRRAERPPTLLQLSFADEELEQALHQKVHALSTYDKLARREVTRRRVESCCKGLLQVAPPWNIELLEWKLRYFSVQSDITPSTVKESLSSAASISAF